MKTLSPNQFKELYSDDFIKNIKVFKRRTGVHVPVNFARVTSVLDNHVYYWYDEDRRQWNLYEGYHQDI